MSKIIKFIKDIIAPKKCYSCQKEGHFLCPQCLSKLSNFRPYCYVCKDFSDNYLVHEDCKKGIYYDRLVVLSHYKNKEISKLVKDAKYYHKKDIFEDFGKYLSDLLIKNIGDLGVSKSDLVLVPVPMYFLRKLYRGYNQSEILTNYISQFTKIKQENKLIKRIKNTRQQSKLSKNVRGQNLDNAFKIEQNKLDKIDKKIIILVDDVASTGTTINEISKLLKQNGVEKIIGLVIASN
ncbi:MAG: ComF family protein [Candidatus Gracilibacteria bacterium]|nr:ComF family protein [Candidatus Gracilibacteria bacterium]